jgi:hypothetical protein
MANMQQMLLAMSGGLSAYLLDYGGVGQIALTATETDNGDGSSSATVQIDLYSDGTGLYSILTLDGGLNDLFTFTWLTGSGSAGDYYAYMDVPSSGSFSSGDATGTSLALSTSRYWACSVYTNAVGQTPPPSEALSTLRIKNSSGVDLVTKSVSLYASASS